MESINAYLYTAFLVSSLFMAVCAIVNYVLIRPVNRALTGMKESVDKFEKSVAQLGEQNHELDKRVLILENRIKTLIKEIEKLEVRMNTITQFCKDTHKSDVPPEVWALMKGNCGESGCGK